MLSSCKHPFAANVRYYRLFRSLASGMADGDRPLLEVRFTDPAAKPGIRYYYAIQHVGTENSHSRHCMEVRGAPSPWMNS
ncbi:MAG: hypothetical protein ACI9QL_000014 [Candidatus Omnitrophota bacterium]|jgi:hypothetical protein